MSPAKSKSRRPRPRAASTIEVAMRYPAGISAATIHTWALACRRRLPVGSGTVSITVLSAPEMRRINRQWRRRDRATNVLSFAYQSGHGRALTAPSVWGEIFLCPPVIRREAVAQGQSYRDYFRFLLGHAWIHLQGYDHHTPRQQAQWQRLEHRLALV